MVATKTKNVPFTLMVTTPPPNATNSKAYKALRKAKERERINETPETKPGLTTARLPPKVKARTEGKVEREKANHLLRDLEPHELTSHATTAKRKDMSPVTAIQDKMVIRKSSHKR